MRISFSWLLGSESQIFMSRPQSHPETPARVAAELHKCPPSTESSSTVTSLAPPVGSASGSWLQTPPDSPAPVTPCDSTLVFSFIALTAIYDFMFIVRLVIHCPSSRQDVSSMNPW